MGDRRFQLLEQNSVYIRYFSFIHLAGSRYTWRGSARLVRRRHYASHAHLNRHESAIEAELYSYSPSNAILSEKEYPFIRSPAALPKELVATGICRRQPTASGPSKVPGFYVRPRYRRSQSICHSTSNIRSIAAAVVFVYSSPPTILHQGGQLPVFGRHRPWRSTPARPSELEVCHQCRAQGIRGNYH